MFSHVYTAIENATDQLLSASNTDERILYMLRTLQTEGLRRSQRLSGDLAEMRRPLVGQDATRIAKLRDYTVQYDFNLRKLLIGRPHLILAWVWNMYLAIFNGGRYIRQALRDGGDQYWDGSPQLRFWEFDGDQDGEDVKNEFKKKFEIAGQSLTRTERAEVVEEAKRVMDVCQEIVQVLDGWHGSPEEKAQTACPESKSVSILVAILAVLAGIWQVLLRICSSWKDVLRPVLERKEMHVD